MRRISYVLSIFIIFVVFIINGEGNQLYLLEAETQFTNITFKTDEDTNNIELRNNIVKLADAFDIRVFFVKEDRNDGEKNIKTFYTDKEAKKILNEEYDIKEGKYLSMTEGTLEIKYSSFDNIPADEIVGKYYFVGDEEDIIALYEKISEVYDADTPMEGYKAFESKSYTMTVWAVAGIIIFTLQLSAVLMNKKEYMLKVTFGESKAAIILKAIMQDYIFFIPVFFITYRLASEYTYAEFNGNITIICLSLILLVSTILDITLPFGDYKKVFSNITVSENMLYLGYTLKLVSSILVTVVISICIVFVSEGIKENRNREFFERYKDYYYTDFNYLDYYGTREFGSKSKNVREDFYRRYFNTFDATMLSWWDTGSESGEEWQFVYANKNILWHLKDNIEELNNREFKKEIYFIVPKGATDDAIECMKADVEDTEGENFEYEYEIIYYDSDNINLLVLEQNSISGATTLKRPYIIYNNTDASKATHDVGNGKYLKSDCIMYKLNKEEADAFIKEYELENHIHRITNVWEKYSGNYEKVKQTAVLSIIIAVLFVILESFVVNNVLKLEYTANAIELSVKKVLGYGVFEKNKKIILTTAITSGICIILAAIVANEFKISSPLYVITGGMIMAVIEFFMIIMKIKAMEKNSVQKILKGGAL